MARVAERAHLIPGHQRNLDSLFRVPPWHVIRTDESRRYKKAGPLTVPFENRCRDCRVALVSIVESNRQAGCQLDSLLQSSQQLSQRDYVEESSEEADKIVEFLSGVCQGVVPIRIVDSVENNDHGFIPTQLSVETCPKNHPPGDGLGTTRQPI
jgi:hypothetical protein